MKRIPRGIKVQRGRSYEDAERVAQSMRAELVPGCGPFERLPGLDLFEDLDRHAVDHRQYGRVPLAGAVVDDLPDEQLARTRWSPGEGALVIELTEETYHDLVGEGPRARFSLWHELAHAFAHTDELLSHSWIPHQLNVAMARGPMHAFYEDSEWQADAISAAAQVPLAYLRHLKARGALSPTTVSVEMGVSPETAVYRIDNARRKQGL